MMDRKKKLEKFRKDLQNYKLPTQTRNRILNLSKDLYDPNLPETEVDRAIALPHRTCEGIHNLETTMQKQIDILDTKGNLDKLLQFYNGVSMHKYPTEVLANVLIKTVEEYDN